MFRTVALGGAVALLCVGLWSISLALPSWLAPPRLAAAASGHPPSRIELDRALARGQGFLSPLYKPIDQHGAVMSEYYGFPLRVYLTGYQKWVIAGREGMALSMIANEFDSERFSVDVRTPHSRHSPRLLVLLDWNAGAARYTLRIRNTLFDDPRTSAEIYLDDLFLGRLDRTNVGRSLRWTFATSERSHLRSLRYSIRHGGQLARNYFAYRGERTKAARLGDVIRRAGFGVNYDISAPIWGAGASYSANMPYDGSASGLSAYHDCDAALPFSSRFYPYRSKVCLGRTLYVWLSHSDTLVPAAEGVHLLNKYGDPNATMLERRFPLGAPIGWDPRASMPRNQTPLTIASRLEEIFRRNGSGIPTCISSRCLPDASGVRTFEFGALETLLGYHFDDAVARSYADAVARVALSVQVRDDAILRTEHGAYYRPAARGSFYLGWNTARMLSSGSTLEKLVHALFDMPSEYLGLVPSNSETTLTAYAFLKLYRCERYGVGCRAPSSLSRMVRMRPNALEGGE
jgi:hypothetical protein